MEDNKEVLNVEQPLESGQVQENVNEVNGTTGHEEKGSAYGKFKDADSLFEAYNPLQKEFTKKCQRLAELEKQKDNAKETGFINSAETQVSAEHEPESDFVAESQAPQAEEDWNSKIISFLKNNEGAKEFSREISEEIVKDELLRKSPNALEIAYGRVVAAKYRSPKEIAKDSAFLENFVYSNDDVKKKVLSIYLKEISENKTPPVISGSIAGAVNMPKKGVPQSLDEARKLVEQMLKV